MGAKKAPFYRIVVADSRYPRDGRFIEEIGYYDPTKKPAAIKVNEERARYWISTGAQPSDTVKALLVKTGVLEKQAAYKKQEKNPEFRAAAGEVRKEEKESAPLQAGAASGAAVAETIEVSAAVSGEAGVDVAAEAAVEAAVVEATLDEVTVAEAAVADAADEAAADEADEAAVGSEGESASTLADEAGAGQADDAAE
jgi:small subunit ribosomal protein S16